MTVPATARRVVVPFGPLADEAVPRVAVQRCGRVLQLQPLWIVPTAAVSTGRPSPPSHGTSTVWLLSLVGVVIVAAAVAAAVAAGAHSLSLTFHCWYAFRMAFQWLYSAFC